MQDNNEFCRHRFLDFHILIGFGAKRINKNNFKCFTFSKNEEELF